MNDIKDYVSDEMINKIKSSPYSSASCFIRYADHQPYLQIYPSHCKEVATKDYEKFGYSMSFFFYTNLNVSKLIESFLKHFGYTGEIFVLKGEGIFYHWINIENPLVRELAACFCKYIHNKIRLSKEMTPLKEGFGMEDFLKWFNLEYTRNINKYDHDAYNYSKILDTKKVGEIISDILYNPNVHINGFSGIKYWRFDGLLSYATSFS